MLCCWAQVDFRERGLRTMPLLSLEETLQACASARLLTYFLRQTASAIRQAVLENEVEVASEASSGHSRRPGGVLSRGGWALGFTFGDNLKPNCLEVGKDEGSSLEKRMSLGSSLVHSSVTHCKPSLSVVGSAHAQHLQRPGLQHPEVGRMDW